MTENWVEHAAKGIPSLVPQTIIAVIGLATLRVWLMWVAAMAKGIQVFGNLDITLRDFYNIGVIMGFAACLFIIARKRSLTYCPAPLVGLILGATGSVLLVVLRNTIGLECLLVSIPVIFLLSSGFAILQASWVDWLGMYAIPLVILLAYIIGWAVTAALWSILGSLGPTSMLFQTSMALMPAISFCSLLLDGKQEGLHSKEPCAALKPCSASLMKPCLPIMVWTWAFAAAYCLGTTYTGLSSSALGETIPLIILVLASLILGPNFDYTTLYRFAFGVLVVGFASAALGGPNFELIQACFSAGNMIVIPLAATFTCAFTAMSRTSAAWVYCAIMMGWYTVPIVIRRILFAVNFNGDASSELYIAVAAAALLALALAVWKETDILSQWRTACTYDEQEQLIERCQALAVRKKLGERETGVLILLAQGKSYDQISEELFIALGTVRAHVAHIYEKLDIHSRQELLDLMYSEELDSWQSANAMPKVG